MESVTIETYTSAVGEVAVLIDAPAERIYDLLNLLSNFFPFLSTRLRGDPLAERVNKYKEPLKCLSS